MNLASVKDDPGVTRQAFEGSASLLNEVRRYTGQNDPPWRIDTVDAANDWATSAPITRVPDANGVSPLALENIIQLRLFLHPGERWGWYYPVERVDSPVLDLMNVKYIITRPAGSPALAASPRYKRLENVAGYDLFENLRVMPRFFLVHEVRPVESLAETRKLIGDGAIDLRRTAITAQPVTFPAGQTPEIADKVTVSKYEPDSLELGVHSAAPGLLVLSENDYPGWRAWLDGTSTPIYRTDIAFRGVAVPAGRHMLRMEFRPMILPVSLAISLVTAGLLIVMAFLGRGRSR